jgi:class 3 adenylate cyclase/HAMP domain-containing protein
MNSRYFFSLRYKIIFAFLGIGFAFSIVLGFVAHKILEEKLFSELRNNVGNITRMGAEIVDKDALRILIARKKVANTPEQVDAVEKSKEYRIVSSQLNFMRDTDKALIHYVYLVTPTEDPGKAEYLVDADVIDLKKDGAADDEISHFNSELDITPFPVMQKALQDRKDIVEDQFVYDETFKINTVSGYAPVLSKDGKTLLALLGLDMADIEVKAALAEVLHKSIVVAVLSLLVALMTAIAMGTWFTRGIVKLDSLVRSFAEKDFAVRAQLKSNDEVGRLGFSFNYMAETIQNHSARLEALLAAYGRFVPHDFLHLLGKESILEVDLGDQVQQDMAVLFSDIRNFTTISEAMSPADNFNFINSYLSQVGPEIRSHKGIIDKYIGDAVMGLFPGSVEDAIDAALAMQKKAQEHNSHKENESYPAIKIGVAVHTGKVMLGTIGEDERMDGTVISDTVNLASRLEGLTKVFGSNVLISDTVFKNLKNPERYFIRLVDKARVVGRKDPVTLYEVCDADGKDMIALKKMTYDDYTRATECFYEQAFTTAEKLFAKVVALNDNDIPAKLFLEKTRSLMKAGILPGWNGVSHYDSKG